MTIDYHDGRPDVVKPLSEIADIVVTGGSGADTLTLAGQLDVPLTFEGGDGDDRISAPSAAASTSAAPVVAGSAPSPSRASRPSPARAASRCRTPAQRPCSAGPAKASSLDPLGALLVAFADIADLFGGSGDDTFVAGQSAELRSLRMGGNDRLVVDIDSIGRPSRSAC